MRRVAQQSLLFLLLLLLVTIIRFPYSKYVHRQLLDVSKELAPFGIEMKIGRTQVSFPAKVTLQRLDLLLPAQGVNVPLLADTVLLKPNLLWLLLFQLRCRGAMSMYGGTVQAELGLPLLGSESRVKVQAGNVALDRHPLVASYGVGGKLNLSLDAELEQVQQSAFRTTRGSLTVNLNSGYYRGAHRIAGLFQLPKLEDVRLELVAEQSGSKLTVERLSLMSSHGELRAAGTVELDDRMRPQSAALRGDLTLSDRGIKEIGQWLALAASLPPDQARAKWKLEFTQKGPLHDPRSFIFRPTPVN